MGDIFPRNKIAPSLLDATFTRLSPSSGKGGFSSALSDWKVSPASVRHFPIANSQTSFTNARTETALFLDISGNWLLAFLVCILTLTWALSSSRNHFCVKWRVKEGNSIFTRSPNQPQCEGDIPNSWRWVVLLTANFSVRANFPVFLEKISCICIPLQAPAQDVGTLKDRKAFCSPNMQVCAMSSSSSTFSGSFHNAYTVQFCWMSAVWNSFLTDRDGEIQKNVDSSGGQLLHRSFKMGIICVLAAFSKPHPKSVLQRKEG